MICAKVFSNALIAGFEHSRFGDNVWQPLANLNHIFGKLGEPKNMYDLFNKCSEISSFTKADYVFACKTRMPSVLLGLYIQKNNNCQLTMDIDDYELGFVKSREQEEFGKYSQISYALEFCKRLDESPVSAFWTHFATKLYPLADNVIVSNSGLQNIYGGHILPHIREIAETRLKRISLL